MNDEQLLAHDPMEARQKLSDDQLERYNELKKQDLQEDIEEKEEEDTENAVEGLEAMRQQAEDELTVSVYGIEFVADINPIQARKLMNLSQFEDKKPEELNDNEFDEVHNGLLDILSDLSVKFDRSAWEEEFGDAGVKTLATIVGELLSNIDDEVGVKKNR